jgi:hypothetical protein
MKYLIAYCYTIGYVEVGTSTIIKSKEYETVNPISGLDELQDICTKLSEEDGLRGRKPTPIAFSQF